MIINDFLYNNDNSNYYNYDKMSNKPANNHKITMFAII